LKTNNTLLAALTFRLSTHPENIATEALMHVLRAHPSSVGALLEHLSHSGLPKLSALTFKSQVHGLDGSIPDLIGCDSNGEEILILEAKFWADLTDNQPETYLNRLSINRPSILLFVCPEARLTTLWGKLNDRVKGTGVLLTPANNSKYLTWANLNNNHYLAILSWRSMLESLVANAISVGDRQYQSDVEQLQGLCDRMDTEAFLPIRSNELSQEIGRRVNQYAELVDEVVALLGQKKSEDISTKGLTTGGNHSAYGRFFKYQNKIGAFLQYSPTLWSKTGVSPLWLLLKDATSSVKWAYHSGITEALQMHSQNSPYRLTDSDDGSLILALPLVCGVEKAVVVESLAKEILSVMNTVIRHADDA
jgi:hypothetical protein